MSYGPDKHVSIPKEAYDKAMDTLERVVQACGKSGLELTDVHLIDAINNLTVKQAQPPTEITMKINRNLSDDGWRLVQKCNSGVRLSDDEHKMYNFLSGCGYQ